MSGGSGGAGERERKRGKPISLREAGDALDRLAFGRLQPGAAAATSAVLGLCVDYRPRDSRTLKPEPGVIVAVNNAFVFVRYWGEAGAKATTPDCLEWAYPEFRS